MRKFVRVAWRQAILALVVVGIAHALGQGVAAAARLGATPVELLTAAIVVAVLAYMIVQVIDRFPRFQQQLEPAWAGGTAAPDSLSEGAFHVLAHLRWREIIGLSGSAAADAGEPAVGPPAADWSRGGGVTLVIALVAAAVVAVLSVYAAVMLFTAAIRRYNLVIGALMVMAPMLYLFIFDREFVQAQTWKKLKDDWLKMPAPPSVVVAGFAGVSLTTEVTGSLLQSGAMYSQVTDTTFVLLYLLGLLLWSWASYMTVLGKTGARQEDSNRPLLRFTLAFVPALLANLVIYTLFFDGLLLALCAYLPA